MKKPCSRFWEADLARDLKLDHLYAVYPGSKAYKLGRNAEAMPLAELAGTAKKQKKEP